MRYIFAVLLIGQLCACTHEQVYNSIKNSQQNDCDNLPWSQREECLKHVAPDYKNYNRERENLHKK